MLLVSIKSGLLIKLVWVEYATGLTDLQRNRFIE